MPLETKHSSVLVKYFWWKLQVMAILTHWANYVCNTDTTQKHVTFSSDMKKISYKKRCQIKYVHGSAFAYNACSVK